MFTIATWNINSIRVRLEHVKDWLAANQPDVLALQEIKVPTGDFPLSEFEELGYKVVVSGQKTYNGVAILVKADLFAADQAMITDFPGYSDPQQRVLGLTVENIFVLNLYVPNGSSLSSDKYHYKLEWLEQLHSFLSQKLVEQQQIIVLGDFNIAPRDQDVHDPLAWKDGVLVSPAERNAWRKLLDLGFIDSFVWSPKGSEIFSWWDYRQGGFQKNHGLRIDHILVANSLVPRLSYCKIDSAPRALERPSDHAPVIATFA